jgi:hypothetical protein
MFGDWNWVNERNQAQRRRELRWFDEVVNSLGNVAIVEIGAGTSIPSVRHFSHRISRELGARIIRINPREPQVPSSKDVGIAAGATLALQAIEAVTANPKLHTRDLGGEAHTQQVTEAVCQMLRH